MNSVVAWALLILVVGGLAALAWYVEPHWVAKDGKRFTCRVREIDLGTGGAQSRWRDRHAFVEASGIRLGGRASLRSVVSGRSGALDPMARVVGRTDGGPKRFATYLLDTDPPLALRVPASSKAVAVLDGLVQPDGPWPVPR